MYRQVFRSLIVGVGLLLLISVLGADDEPGPARALRLTPSKDNPRNSEGDFITLKDGRILFVYTHFTGGSGDAATAYLAGRFSSDGGKTWTDKDVVIVPQEGKQNVMSVSLLRLQDGRIALFYLRKNSLTDCRVVLRFSKDEAVSWSDPIECITDEVAYYVMNNDRAVQLKSGRLVLPVALHNTPKENKFDRFGRIMCYLSDDGGKSWRRGKDVRQAKSPEGKDVVLQEPGVVELKDGRLMSYCRTDAGSQYVAYSKDGGDTWSEFGPSNMLSPLSPAVIKRIPKTGDLLLVWNNHDKVAKQYRGKRTPFNAAISKDDGKTWQNVKTLEDDPDGWYCYTAVEFAGEYVLLGHCAGSRKKDGGLAVTQITRFSVDWLYK